jgi:hypothetical protein
MGREPYYGRAPSKNPGDARIVEAPKRPELIRPVPSIHLARPARAIRIDPLRSI